MEIQAALDQAQAHHRAGRLPEAESGFRAILARDPQNFLAWHHLSIIQLQRGLLPDALQHVRESLALEPRSIAALSNQGLVLQGLNRLDEALASYDRAQALAPADQRERASIVCCSSIPATWSHASHAASASCPRSTKQLRKSMPAAQPTPTSFTPLPATSALFERPTPAATRGAAKICFHRST